MSTLAATTLLLLAAAPEAPAGSSRDAILEAFPNDPDHGVHLEAALVCRDLRLLQRSFEHQRSSLRETRLGASFYTPEAQAEVFGYDPLVQLGWLVELAAPSGAVVPAGLALASTANGPVVELAAQVEPGFLERVAEALASPSPPAWTGVVAGDELTVEIAGYTFAGAVGEDGWFRMVPRGVARLGGGANPFPGNMRTWTDELDTMLLLNSGGPLLAKLLSDVVDGAAGQVVRSTRAAALGWTFDGDKTWTTRLVVDSPMLESIRGGARAKDLSNSLASVWDADAAGFLSLSLPPVLTLALLPLAERQLREAGVQPPEALMQGLSQLDGRIGFVSFGAPGDWAVAFGLRDAEAAQALVPALRELLAAFDSALGTQAAESGVLEPLPGAGQVLHLRPDVGIEGIRVAAVGKSVVMASGRTRLEGLVVRAARAGDPELGAVAGPVTPPIRESLNEPAMVLGYTVLGADSTVASYLMSGVLGLQQVWKKQRQGLPEIPLLEAVMERLPTYVTLQGITWSLLYDTALWADLRDSVLVVQLHNSEI